MAPDTEPAVLLSVEQAARRLGISAHSVRRLGKSGELATVQYLGRVFFRVEDIDTFINDHTFEAA